MCLGGRGYDGVSVAALDEKVNLHIRVEMQAPLIVGR